MSGQDDIALIALLVSLIALLISLGQLLQSIFGTAEGFRRTNKNAMSLFAQTRDRVFHLTELRFETKFSTPHFTFHTGFDESLWKPTIKSRPPLPKPKLAITIAGCRIVDLNELIRSTGISKMQRFLNLLDPSSASPNDPLVSDEARGYAASWLLLLEQLYEHDSQFYQSSEDDVKYTYVRQGDKSSPNSPSNQKRQNNQSSMGCRRGPDMKQVRFPAIESHVRSWDLLPPDVVRPLASMSFGDLLTLCARLRITVRDENPRTFSADGFGHSFWTLRIQGLGTVVQYHYNKMGDTTENKYYAFRKFIPCEDADKLAFGIIPKNENLGIERDWQLGNGRDYGSFVDAMKIHFEELGVTAPELSMVVVADRGNNDVWRTFGDTLLLLAPFMPIDGLGIAKCSLPMIFHWWDCLLWMREGRIVLWQRMNDLAPASPAKNTAPADKPRSRGEFESDLDWISHVLNFFDTEYHDEFRSVRGLGDITYNNAHNDRAYTYLQRLRVAYEDADAILIGLFKQDKCTPTYQYMVAAHHEMALAVHAAVNRELRSNPDNKNKPEWDRVGIDYRNKTGTEDLWKWKTEIMNRYIDHVTEEKPKVKRTIVEIYREKTEKLKGPSDWRPAKLTDKQIRDGWCTMMLRGCLWSMTHQLVSLPNLPYPSRLWQDSTLVLIA